MRILVLGSNGQLGRCLADQLAFTEHEVIYASRAEIDIGDFESTNRKIKSAGVEVVINATAFTAVDRAESEEEEANLVNQFAVGNIADTCAEVGCWLIHVSTDYVFDGSSTKPYKEADVTNPQGVYGGSKLRGELAIQSSDCKYLIFRTAWVFSEYGNNFMKTMLRLGAERDELSIVGDQIGCPTYAQDIAKAIVQIISRLSADKPSSSVYHFCGDRPCSWFEFAVAIFEEAKNLGLRTPAVLREISTAEYPTPALRPAYSVLDSSKISRDFGLPPANWRDGVREILSKV
jgi:dTDP-4-dehydrorhamnose reductase